MIDSTEMARPAFGGWLATREPQGDWIDDLAKVAAGDRSFPRAAGPETVRIYLGNMGASGDMFERLDDAEMEWLGW